MYAQHFGLTMMPFENETDPMSFFNEGEHARILTSITESLKTGRNLIVVTGPVGSGKTFLSQMIKSSFPDDIKLISQSEPPGNSVELFLFIARELGLKPYLPISNTLQKAIVIRDIGDALIKINSEGKKCLLIIDEVHQMTDDVLNGIRLLSNLEKDSTKLINILLLGQEELMELMSSPEMEPFKQYITSVETIGKIGPDSIKKYVQYRIQVAGGQSTIFSKTGWKALGVVFDSGATPHVINSLCNRSIALAFEKEKMVVEGDDVYMAAKDMELGKEGLYDRYVLKKGGGKNRMRTFLRVILGKKDSMATEKNETDIPPEESEMNTKEETDITDTSIDKTAMADKDLPSSEWIRINSIGAKSFLPVTEQEKITGVKPEALSNPDKWIRAGSRSMDSFSEGNDNNSLSAKKASPSSEWVRINSKVAKSFQTDNVKKKTTEAKQKTASNNNEWMRAGSKDIDDFAESSDKVNP
jgi:general secretion pathway protein A